VIDDPGFVRTHYISKRAATALGDKRRSRGAIRTFHNMAHTSVHVKIAMDYIIPALADERYDVAVKAIAGMAHTPHNTSEISERLSSAMLDKKLRGKMPDVFYRASSNPKFIPELLPSLIGAMKDKRRSAAVKAVDRLSTRRSSAKKIGRALLPALADPASRSAATVASIRLFDRYPPVTSQESSVVDLARLHDGPAKEAVERILKSCKRGEEIRRLIEERKRSKGKRVTRRKRRL